MTEPNGLVILGINCAYHESAAALIRDGHIVAAVEEERFSGRKHGKALRVDNAHHLPWAAIRYCFEAAGITWQELDAVAYSLDPALRRQYACLGSEGSPLTFGHPVGEERFQQSLRCVPELIAEYTNAPFFFVPHHDAHAWYAMGTSPFHRAVVLVADGIGEGASLSMGIATRSSLDLNEQDLFPASIGIAWEKVSRFIGLSEYDACKVMALAGLNNWHAPLPFEQLMTYREDGLWLDQEVLNLEFPDDFAGMSRYFGPRDTKKVDSTKNRRLAAGIQRTTEQLLLDVVRHLVRRHGERHLVYGGGVALNCRANAVLAASGKVDAIHVGPATHDAGTALGAAWHVHTKLTQEAVPLQKPCCIVYSGPSITMEEVALRVNNWTRVQVGDTLTKVVDLLTSGELIGWCEGRCEFGPRALGARSLLASPLSKDVVEQVNKVKGRAAYEPLAVSILAEKVNQVFDLPEAGRGLADFMLITATPTKEWSERLSHMVHGDGTVRVQVVQRDTTPRFYQLLKAFDERVGVPLLVNTSFNPRGEPIPAMLDRILRMANMFGLQCLVVDDYILACTEKRPMMFDKLPERVFL